jgi:hypothetical protein
MRAGKTVYFFNFFLKAKKQSRREKKGKSDAEHSPLVIDSDLKAYQKPMISVKKRTHEYIIHILYNNNEVNETTFENERVLLPPGRLSFLYNYK